MLFQKWLMRGNEMSLKNLTVESAIAGLKNKEFSAAELAEAHELAGKIGRLKPKFTLEIGANGKAFGSVTSIDIHKALEEKGFTIDRTAIQLAKPIKSSGKTDVEIKIHPEVSTSVTVTVEAPEAAE